MKLHKRIVAGISAFAMFMSVPLDSGFVAVAEETITTDATQDETIVESDFSLDVQIQDTWTNTVEDWTITTDADAVLYYKTKSSATNDDEWGTYSDSDAKLWNGGHGFEDSEGFIKFWAVKMVDNEEVSVTVDAVSYRFDSTPPNSFNVEKIEVDKNSFAIKNTSGLSDNLSGLEEVWYKINADDGQEYNSGIQASLENDAFEIPCVKEMNESTVTVYLVDKAGNWEKSSVYIDTYKDLSKPHLEVNGIDSETWVNNLDSWNVYSNSENVTIYFETSDTELDDWGDYPKDKVWPDSKGDIPEGDKFIHFWAVYDDSERMIAEVTTHYKYDKTNPKEFNLEYEYKSSYLDADYKWHEPVFVIEGTGIIDEISGINQNKIYYTVQQENNNVWKRFVEISHQEKLSDGSISFSLDLSNEEYLHDAFLTFYVVDNAGNEVPCPMNKQAINYDGSAPVIKNSENEMCITSSDGTNKEPSYYLDKETEELYASVYANDEDYLKITIVDNNLKEIQVQAKCNSKDDENKFVIFTSDGANNTLKWDHVENGTDTNENVYFIKLSDIGMTPEKEYSLEISAKDDVNPSKSVRLIMKDEGGDVEYSIRYDTKGRDEDKITFIPKANSFKDAFVGNISENDCIDIDIIDDYGISKYEVRLKKDDEYVFQTSAVCEVTATMTTTSTVIVTDDVDAVVTNSSDESQTETISNVIEYKDISKSEMFSLPLVLCKENGKYVIEAEVTDVAGNVYALNYDFNVDTIPPEIDDFSYKTNSSLLNFLTFGIFGNKTLSISINVSDNDLGVGVNPEKVLLYWAPTNGENLKEYTAELVDEETGEYTFKDLPINNEAVPYIVVSDKLGNTNTYYFATKEEIESSSVGELIINDEDAVILALEDDKPSVSVSIPSTYTKYIVSGEAWYGAEIEYVVSAMDANSGLNRVEIQENDGDPKQVTSFDDINFTSTRFQDEATYTYKLVNANDYTIIATAYDNAGNQSDPAELKLHIDKENPVISKFVFGEQEDLGSEIAKTTYGYYFKEETDVRIYVNDPSVTSGINSVTLTLSNIDGTVAKKTVHSTDVQAYITDETGEYAVFTIPMGFKGAVVAEVVDNVEHTSGLINADGSIIEDETIHSSTSSINIAEDVNITKVDNDNTLLFNQSIPLTISVKDTFSGISTIEWSIANDGESGIITVANDGKCDSNSSAATIGEVETESNLVTSMQFTLSVDDNSNGNVVLIKLTDRSGNTSEVSKAYSIDTTVPTISASLSNQTPHNTMYYNTDQTVTVSITERNFNASDVHFMLNGSEQIIGNWSTSGNGDSAVHTGKFTISTDGDYSYSISYSDMAGNMGEVFTQSMFVVDKTSPVIKTNFDEFKTEQEKHYFGIESINKIAKITITEHNFSAKDANVEIFRLEPGSKHDVSGIESTTVSGWSDNGDEHTLEIPFEDGDDGVYLIRVTPVDLASNSGSSQETVVFEIDFTNPIISERNGVYAKDEEKSYEHLEVYNEITGVEEGFIPSVSFSDTNFDHIEYALTVYTPEYKNGKEIGDIIPDSDSGSITEAIYSLPEFEKDGVYSVDLVAVDVAGNRSTLCRNTSVLMMESDVLAYISNSSKAESTGWYSLQKDENNPISKRPDSFTDLYITVFAQEASDTRIILRNANGESQDTGITAENSEDMYAVGVYNYILPKEYFADNYPEGTNEDLYLWAENSLNGETSHISLGWIRLDALAPSCNLPSDLKDWKSYVSTTKKITLTNISESLDISKCVVYDNGKEISMDNFEYSEENNTLSYTLEKGWHDLSFVLVDEAGNINTIQEISSIQVGLLYCLWFRILCGVIAVAGIVAIIIIIRKKKSVSK